MGVTSFNITCNEWHIRVHPGNEHLSMQPMRQYILEHMGENPFHCSECDRAMTWWRHSRFILGGGHIDAANVERLSDLTSV